MILKYHKQNLEALQFAVLSSTLLLLLRTRTQAVRTTFKEVLTVTSDHSWFGLKSKGCLFLNCTFTLLAFVLRRKIEYFKVHLGISNLISLSGINLSFSLVMVNANSSPAQKVFKSTMANNISILSQNLTKNFLLRNYFYLNNSIPFHCCKGKLHVTISLTGIINSIFSKF